VSSPELLLVLARRGGGGPSAAPLHEQLELELRELVRSGRLQPGTRLPSTRVLARQLGVSRGVVLEAYAQLTAEGYVTARQGAPTRVALTPAAERPPVAASSLVPQHAYRFDPGMPDLSSFPRASWLRALRLALRDAPFAALGYDDPRGTVELRNALMSYLGRSRGAAPEPEHTIVCGGFTQGFAVLCRSLRARGVERMAIEDPGWASHRLIAQSTGLEVVGIPVDDGGIVVEALGASGCEAVVVTPAHQFPTGVVLAPGRRAALLAWAEDEDGLIVEDDFDGELRFDRDPLGALQGLAPERVAYIGSASKRLAPALRLGWVLSPSWLTGTLTYEKGIADGGSPAVEQLAFADFIARGELDRHVRRMRLRYRARRAALRRAIERSLPGIVVTGVAAGLFAPALLPGGCDEEAVLRAAAERGVGLDGLSWHRIGDGPPGLLLGYANLSEQAIAQGVLRIAEAVGWVGR
jgi:GntR family transcriptional regulator/MocR family aminotransferase